MLSNKDCLISETKCSKLSSRLKSIESCIIDKNSHSYRELLKVLIDQTIGDDDLLWLIEGFKSCILQLDKSHEYIVGYLLALNWHMREAKIVEQYILLLSELVTAHTGYLTAVLKSLVKRFTPTLAEVKENVKLSIEIYEWQFDNVHVALENILKIIPLSSKLLLPSIVFAFPYHGKPLIVLECYVRNLITLLRYCPQLQQAILEVIMDNLIKIDVELPKHAVELMINEQENDQFGLEIDTKPSKIQENAMKLDKLLIILCNYIGGYCLPNSSIVDLNACMVLAKDVTSCFEKLLLPTHSSSYVQFLIFYFCSLDESISNHFVELLWTLIQNPSLSSVLRQSAAGYLGSLIARARFVSISNAKSIIVQMVDWLHRYITLQDGSSIQADICKHAAFYSVCQNLMYLFIFRHRQLIFEEDGMVFCRGLNFERIITCRLNPLKFSLKTVVDMFARITRMHEIVFCYTIIDRNNRCQLPIAQNAHEMFDSSRYQNILDTFFPFDPCLLPETNKIISRYYQDWEDNSVITHDTRDNDSEDEIYGNAIRCAKEKESLSWQHMAHSPFSDMCVSPGFQSGILLHLNEV